MLRARFSLDHDGRSLRALMARAMETAGVSLRDLKPRRGSDPVGAFMNGLTRVRAALEPPAAVEVQIESVGETPLAQPAVRARARAVHPRAGRDRTAVVRRPDLLRRRRHAGGPGHRAFIQSRFDHVLVDEFQDLNGAQLALVDVLSRPHRRLFVVGDDDQLIYGWRQADPRGILEFHRRMPPKPWSATYTLCTNYRCSRAVVETGARLVANNVVREAKEIRPRAGAQDGAVRFFGAPSWPERAAAVCAFLRAEKERLGCGWRDLAVLCRYRSQQLLVALALDAGDVPRTPALGCTLFTHPAAVLLRAYLDLVRAPDELPGPALAGLLNRPNRYVSAAAAEAVAAATRPWAHLQSVAAQEPAAGPRPLSALVELVAALRPRIGAALDGACTGARPDDPARGAQLTRRRAGCVRSPPRTASGRSSRPSPSTTSGPRRPTRPRPATARAPTAPARSRSSTRSCSSPRPTRTRPPTCAPGTACAPTRQAHLDVADDTLSREESEDDLVVIGTIHAAKGREYDSIVIPDYDCDVSPLERRGGGGGAPRRLRGRHPRPRRGAVHGRQLVRVRPPVPARARRGAGARRARRAQRLARRGARRRAARRASPTGSRRSRCSSRSSCRRRRRRPRAGRRPRARADRSACGRLTAAAQRSQSRMDGSGGATKCFAVGSVPGRRYCFTSCCSSRSVTVRRWC